MMLTAGLKSEQPRLNISLSHATEFPSPSPFQPSIFNLNLNLNLNLVPKTYNYYHSFTGGCIPHNGHFKVRSSYILPGPILTTNPVPASKVQHHLTMPPRASPLSTGPTTPNRVRPTFYTIPVILCASLFTGPLSSTPSSTSPPLCTRSLYNLERENPCGNMPGQFWECILWLLVPRRLWLDVLSG